MLPTRTSINVRESFINFFQSKNHVFVPSSSVVPENDPTLLFINAGMNQFKKRITGDFQPSYKFADITRATNSQKCIRAGGKHNDLDDVGTDLYHHTFFEMLGNWSFGDFFKKEAIDFAWEYLTKVLKLPEDRIYATYYGGCESCPEVEADEEAREMWRAYLPDDRILPGNFKDNFWEMGASGPCGPCSELHFDRGNDWNKAFMGEHTEPRNVAHLVNEDHPEVIEIWNLVFMQYCRLESGKLETLPNKCVDTGMGFERVLSILNGTTSNYDTDLFIPIMKKIEEVGLKQNENFKPYTGTVEGDNVPLDVILSDVAYRVLADHARTLVVALSDGAIPSASGRGYVVRRIIRRALRYQLDNLDIKGYLISDLALVVKDILGDVFPSISANFSSFQAIINEEQDKFESVLIQSKKVLLNRIAQEKNQSNTVLSGKTIFDMYTSYGLPFDIIEIIAKENSMSMDTEEYYKLLEVFKATSRATCDNDDQAIILNSKITQELQAESIPSTDDSYKYDYQTTDNVTKIQAKVLSIIEGEGRVTSTSQKRAGLILDKTNFYVEAGGQVGDIGTLVADNGKSYQISSVIRVGGYIMHIIEDLDINLSINDVISLGVDEETRSRNACNHTATHMLHHMLRKHCLNDVKQRGSYLNSQYLRFDYTCNSALSLDTLKEIETSMNHWIYDACNVDVSTLSKEMAMEDETIHKLDDEEYPETVRVVKIAVKNLDDNISSELCGGTHIKNTSEIRSFSIISDGSISKGVRRIVCCTKTLPEMAEENLTTALLLESQIADTIDLTNLKDLCGRLEGLLSTDFFPLLPKRRLQQLLETKKKLFVESDKALNKALSKKSAQVTKWVVDLLSSSSSEEHEEYGSVYDAPDRVIINLKTSIGKNIPALINSVQKIINKPVFVISENSLSLSTKDTEVSCAKIGHNLGNKIVTNSIVIKNDINLSAETDTDEIIEELKQVSLQ